MTYHPNTARPKVKAKCCTPKIVYWLQRNGRTVGLAMAMANGTWAAYSHGEVEERISPVTFKSPHEVASWAERMGLGA